MKILTLIILFITSNIVAAETIYETQHEVDKWEQKMLKNAKTTQDILAVHSQAYTRWDRALNKSYKSLITKIPKKDKVVLRESQRNWNAFKKPEFKFMAIHIQREGGTLSRVIAAQRRVAFIRNRVIELEAYEFIFDSPP